MGCWQLYKHILPHTDSSNYIFRDWATKSPCFCTGQGLGTSAAVPRHLPGRWQGHFSSIYKIQKSNQSVVDVERMFKHIMHVLIDYTG